MKDDRREVLNSALRDLHDELERLDANLGIRRASSTREIVRRALAAEYIKGQFAQRDRDRLTYDGDELELKFV